jgi:hypothetical protein
LYNIFVEPKYFSGCKFIIIIIFMPENDKEIKEVVRSGKEIEGVLKKNIESSLDKKIEDTEKEISNRLEENVQEKKTDLKSAPSKPSAQAGKPKEKEAQQPLPEKDDKSEHVKKQSSSMVEPQRQAALMASRNSAKRQSQEGSRVQSGSLDKKPLGEVARKKDDKKEDDKGVKKSDEQKASDLSRDQKKSKKNKGKADMKMKEKKASPGLKIRFFFDKALKKAYELIPETFGISILYIYLHAFLNMIFPFNKFFCKLGHEWAPDNLKIRHPKKAEEIGDKRHIPEKAACFASCAILIYAVIMSLVILYITIFPHKFAWEFMKAAWQGFLDTVWCGFLGFGCGD